MYFRFSKTISGNSDYSIIYFAWIETESEKLMCKWSAKEIIEMGQEFGLDDTQILDRLQKKLNLSAEAAVTYLTQYGKVLV
jgi:hypothetical protein